MIEREWVRECIKKTFGDQEPATTKKKLVNKSVGKWVSDLEIMWLNE